MRSQRRRNAGYLVALLTLSTATFSACGGGGDETTLTTASTSSAQGAGSGQGGAGGGLPVGCDKSPNEDPAALIGQCGIFVAETVGDDDFDGSAKAPVRTLGKAISTAMSSGKSRVYACRGTYDEAIVVPPGMSLYGGLDCTDLAWAPRGTGAMARTTVQGGDGQIPLRLKGGDAAAPITMDGFSIKAASATTDGGSSIAAIAEDKAVVSLSASELQAGDGAPGAPGEDADPQLPMTVQPGDANKGWDACEDPNTNYGGALLKNDCGDGGISIGGSGGDATKANGQSGQDGLPADPSMPGAGLGGAGGVTCDIGAGKKGAPGKHGDPGAPGAGMGMLSAEGWLGSNGTEGEKGKVAQGGGGGGGRQGNALCAGPGGGAGGAGGCGGAAGKGGQAGGASIALISLNASITLSDVMLIAGLGGAGGDGGDAQLGGLGSPGSPGGASAAATPTGCPGGDGGNGGNGSSGGGAAGGHALGVAFIGAAPQGDFDATVPAMAGAGGLGGNLGVQQNNGESGIAQAMLEFPSP